MPFILADLRIKEMQGKLLVVKTLEVNCVNLILTVIRYIPTTRVRYEKLIFSLTVIHLISDSIVDGLIWLIIYHLI